MKTYLTEEEVKQIVLEGTIPDGLNFKMGLNMYPTCLENHQKPVHKQGPWGPAPKARPKNPPKKIEVNLSQHIRIYHFILESTIVHIN
jgi:hypothetical protein